MGGFSKSFKEAGGEVVAEVWPPFPNTDYAPFLEQIRGPRPEAVFCFFAGSDAVNFVKQFDDFGLKKDIKLLGSGFMLEQDTFPAQGNAAIGGISGLHYASTLDNAENKKFTDDYQKRFNKPADVYAVQGFDTARVIVDALNQTQGNTSNKDALVKVIEGTSFNSPRGPFNMDPESHAPIQNIYAREVRGQNGQPTNFAVATFPNVKDPA
jgi:branched-chain amino acid transport system substrate-binding protein